jgi:predicted  nucleic acid-binding Zn-ribbon protein
MPYTKKTGDNGIAYLVDDLGKPVSDVPTISSVIKQYGSWDKIPTYTAPTQQTQQQTVSSPSVSSSTIKVSDTGKTTLTGVAHYLGVDLEALKAANPLLKRAGNKLGDWNLIYSTDVINIPGKTTQQTQQQPPSVNVDNVNNNQQFEESANSDQAKDASEYTSSEEPATKKSAVDINALLSSLGGDATTNADIVKTAETKIEDVAKLVAPTTAKPELIDLTTQYEKYRSDYSINDLETQLSNLNTQLSTLESNKQARVNAERGKTVATNVIEGRVSEVERQENERMSAIEDQITTITNQLNTKYNIINTLMTLTQKDYDNAVASYDSELKNNIAMLNLVQGIDEAAKSEAEQKADTARANLQIVYNAITSGGSSISDLTSDQQTLISKLEVQAGLPTGFYKTLEQTEPDSKVVTTANWTSADNKEYVSVVTQNKQTGEIKTKNYLLGASTSSTNKATENELKTYYKQNMAAALDKVIGTDGYVSPENWATALKSWTTNTPYTAQDFVDNFISYVNPKTKLKYTGISVTQ